MMQPYPAKNELSEEYGIGVAEFSNLQNPGEIPILYKFVVYAYNPKFKKKIDTYPALTSL